MATKRNDKLTKNQLWNIISKTENELDTFIKENDKLRKQINDLNFVNKKLSNHIGTIENELSQCQERYVETKKELDNYKKHKFLNWLFGRK